MKIYYKVLSENGEACHGGYGTWHLPNGRRPGKWMPKITKPVCCVRGYHLVTREQLVWWLGPAIWIAEGRGARDTKEDKTAFEQARLIRRLERWNDTTARLFAADCAERVLPIYEKAYPGDDRPGRAIEASRAFVEGRIKETALNRARDVARAAASVACAPYCIPAPAAYAGYAAHASAAYVACANAACAVAACDNAAYATRAAAAEQAERKWQIKRLWEYLDGKIKK